jgi:hypothetical protein
MLKETMMAKQAKATGVTSGKKDRGRTQVTKVPAPAPTRPMTPQDIRAAVNRPVTASGNMNKHRGDRRDTSRTYAGNTRHASRGGGPQRDVATRAR